MDTCPVQTKRHIEAVLLAAGVHPNRRFGQHFLIDGNLMRRLADSADVAPDDVVLEVGPGTGGLTDLLLPRAARVIAVEIDHTLHDILTDRYADQPRLTLLRADALENKNHLNPALLDACERSAGRLLLVANLPYDIATPLLMNLLLAPVNVRRLCFTVQREVGERLDARPQTKAYGPLSIILQTVCRAERIARVPATAFWPRPAVESNMYRLDVVPHPFERPGELAAFAALVRGAFLHRRKTLRHFLSEQFAGNACDALPDLIDPASRPEAVTPAQWAKLAAVLAAQPNRDRRPRPT